MISTLLLNLITESFTEGELRLQDSIDEEILKMNFSNYIRAGKDDKMKMLLQKHRKLLLETWYTFQVNIKKRTSQSEDEIAEADTATIEVSPLHLAIISKQGSCLDVILTEILSLFSQHVTEEDSRIPTDTKFLEALVSVKFPGNDGSFYHDEDRMLDGMNILHLAAKYYPKGLEKIICTIQKNKAIFQMLKDVLLIGVDNQINNTPFHVAASSQKVTALR